MKNKLTIGSMEWAKMSNGKLNWKEKIQFINQAISFQIKDYLFFNKYKSKDFLLKSKNIKFEELKIPDSRTVKNAILLMEAKTPLWLQNHCYRTWSWSLIFSKLENLYPDPEILAISCLLHDIALLPEENHSCELSYGCFSVQGSSISGNFLEKEGWDSQRIIKVQNSISLHMNIEVELQDGLEAYLLHEGASCDVVGNRAYQINKVLLNDILNTYKRDGFKSNFRNAMNFQAKHTKSSRVGVLTKLGFQKAIQNSSWSM